MTQETTMIGKTIGNLRIISELGKGGMGVVYLAEHPILDKKFAVKSLSSSLTQDPEFRERFYQEARNQALLDHPNIVQVTDFIEEDEQFFLVMQYVDGQDLGKMIKETGGLAEQQALSIFKNVLEGLDFAHERGIIHRDVKPSNILVDKTGRARIMDFGISVMFGAERLTATGSTVGSPWYMSPEQIVHPKDIDHRSDVYSAGIVLYEMLTGDVPFDGDSDWSVKNAQVNAPRPNPCDKNQQISPELGQMVLKAIDTVPDKRFQGCAEFLARLKEYEQKDKIIPVRPTKKLWGGLAVLVLVVAALAVYIINRPPDKVVIKANVEQEHRSAAILIDGATKEVTFICKEMKAIRLIQDRIRIVRNTEDREMISEYVPSYNKQIHDKNRNIRDSLTKYNGYIERLGDLTNRVVGEEFENYTKRLKKAGLTPIELSDRSRVNHSLQAHYQEYLNHKDHKPAVDETTIRRVCGGE